MGRVALGGPSSLLVDLQVIGLLFVVSVAGIVVCWRLVRRIWRRDRRVWPLAASMLFGAGLALWLLWWWRVLCA